MAKNSSRDERFKKAQSSLVTQASDFSLDTVASMVRSGAIDPSPGYQRRERWDAARQSALIESFMLNVPVPPVYLAEEDYGAYSVIDGKQRITAVSEFMEGKLALRRLEKFSYLNGARFEDLPPEIANALRVRPYVRAVTLLRQSDPDLKFEVFLRLNRGGEKLTAQEVRNVAFRGEFNDLLFELAKNDFLLSQFNIDEKSERYRQMLDLEYVLRFLSLDAIGDAYTGDLSATMDSFMERYWSEYPIDNLAHAFNRSIEACQSIWGDKAFRRAEKGSWRGRALLGMYDAQMLAVSKLNDKQIASLAAKQGIVHRRTAELFDDAEFLQAVTVATNTSARLSKRVNTVSRMLSLTLGE